MKADPEDSLYKSWNRDFAPIPTGCSRVWPCRSIGVTASSPRPRGRPKKSAPSTQVSRLSRTTLSSTLRLSQTVNDMVQDLIGSDSLAIGEHYSGQQDLPSPRSQRHRGESPSSIHMSILATDSRQSTLQTGQLSNSFESDNMEPELIDPLLLTPPTRKRRRGSQHDITPQTPGTSRQRSALVTIDPNAAVRNHHIDRGNKRTIKLTAHSTLRESMFK
jgi:hypothetical protein